MKRNDIVLIVGVLMLSLATLLTGCGGGGADTSRSGGSDATLTAANAPQVGDAVTQAVKLVVPTTALGGVKAGSVSSGRHAPLMSIFQTAVMALGNQGVNQRQASAMSHTDCSGGGNIEVGTPEPVSLDHVQADVNINSCTMGAETMNGVLKVTVPTSALSDLKHVSEFTVEVSSFTYTDPHVNVSFTDNFTMIGENITYSGSSLTGGTLTMGGTVTGTIDGGSVNIQCDSFRTQFSSGASGVSVSVSGRINALCLGGWVALATNQPVFIPAGANCPTAGDVSVTGAGGSTVGVVFGSDSRVNIFFNGALIQTYNSCMDVVGVCKG